MVTMQSTVQVPEGVLFQDLNNEAVILNTVNGQYYGLDPVGARMWQLVAQHDQLEPVLSALCTEYKASEETLRNDLLGLVEKLVEKKLLVEAV